MLIFKSSVLPKINLPALLQFPACLVFSSVDLNLRERLRLSIATTSIIFSLYPSLTLGYPTKPLFIYDTNPLQARSFLPAAMVLSSFPYATADTIPLSRHPNGTPLSSMIPDNSDNNDEKGNSNTCFLSVASFNLLAPCYVRPIDKRTGDVQPFAAFDWVQDETILDWETRKHRLLNCLQSCKADIICLQELQLEVSKENDNNDNLIVLPEWLRPIIEQCGYEAYLPSQEALDRIAVRNVRVLGIHAAVASAVLVRQHSSSTTANNSSCQWIVCKDSFAKDKIKRHESTCVSVCLYHQSDSTDIDPIVVTSIHLDATSETKRVTQLSRCLKRARNLIDDHVAIATQNNSIEKPPYAKKYPSLSTIIAGDFNTECSQGSAVASFFDCNDNITLTSSSASGLPQSTAVAIAEKDEDAIKRECAQSLRLSPGSEPSLEQLAEWKELQSMACQTVYDYCVSITRIETGPTRCAYGHDEMDWEDNENVCEDNSKSKDTSPPLDKTMSQWKLDHIIYTTNQLQPVATWQALEADPESCQTGLPNHKFPSDHLPLAAVFKILPNYQLNSDDKKMILDEVQTLIERQKQTLDELETKMDSELELIQSKFTNATNNDDDDSHEQNKVQQKGENTKKKAKKDKKKRKNTGPPPKEVIDCIRKKRTLVNDLRQKYQLERKQLVENWNGLQRLTIQEAFGITCREWIDRKV